MLYVVDLNAQMDDFKYSGELHYTVSKSSTLPMRVGSMQITLPRVFWLFVVYSVQITVLPVSRGVIDPIT